MILALGISEMTAVADGTISSEGEDTIQARGLESSAWWPSLHRTVWVSGSVLV